MKIYPFLWNVEAWNKDALTSFMLQFLWCRVTLSPPSILGGHNAAVVPSSNYRLNGSSSTINPLRQRNKLNLWVPFLLKKLGRDRFVRYNNEVAGKKAFNLHDRMGQLSRPPNSPTGGWPFLWNPGHVSEVAIASSCLYEQSGHAPDEMMDVLWGDVVCWDNTWCLKRCSIGFMSGEQVEKWIASMSPSSRTCRPPPTTGGWTFLWNDRNTAAICVVVPPQHWEVSRDVCNS